MNDREQDAWNMDYVAPRTVMDVQPAESATEFVADLDAPLCDLHDDTSQNGHDCLLAAEQLSDGAEHDHAEKSSRRSFLASTVGTVGSLVVGDAVLPQQLAEAAAAPSRALPDWRSLRRRIQGEVVAASAPNFDAARSALVWNQLKPDRSPDAIVRVKNERDVVEAVSFARENGLQVVCRGGGHTWCGLAVRNGGITLDLSALNESRVDPTSRTAAIQPVISNRELARRLGQFGLAFPIGHCPTVKAGGYLLNGGMAWNMGHWGPACLSVEAVEFVTADGKQITASATEHPDLFWAARGCGPGMFAVATRFHLKCYPLPRAIATSNYSFSLHDLQEAVDDVVAAGRKMPDKVELSIFLMQAPAELAEACRDHNGKLCLVSAVAFGMTNKESAAALAPLEQCAVIKKALARSVNQPSSFEQLAIASGKTWPENHRNLCENQCSKANPSDILMALRDKFVEAPSDKSVIVFCQSTGSKNLLEPHPEVALSMDATSYGGSWAIWEKEADDAANRKWQEEVVALLKPFTSQHYIGETDIVQDPSRVEESYSAEKWRRLEAVRAKYDPAGVFFGFLGGTGKA